MHGITFINIKNGNSYHSYDDFNLILKPRTLQVASPKIETVEIPGADGDLDLTDWFGEVHYKNVDIEYDFSYIGALKDWDNQYALICNTLNGQKMKIIEDKTPTLYRVGRVQVSEWKANKAVGEISIEIDCEPYRYKESVTVVQGNAGTITCINSRKAVVPTLQATAEMSIEFEGNTYTVGTTQTTIPSIIFKEGNNILKVEGDGVLTITYQEGML